MEACNAGNSLVW